MNAAAGLQPRRARAPRERAPASQRRLALLGTGTVGAAFVDRYQRLQSRGLALPRVAWLANSRSVQTCEDGLASALEQALAAPRREVLLQGWAEAEALRAEGDAKASAILATGEAEAEAMNKRADAYSRYNEAAVLEMLVKALPAVARELAAPMGNIDKLTVVSTDGAAALPKQVNDNVVQTIELLKNTTGVDLANLLERFSGKTDDPALTH